MVVNKATREVIIKISGRGFHRDLHRLCSVVAKPDRRFDGEYWHIKEGITYADLFKEWWPEYCRAVKAFEGQLELPL
jgi:hypothetical protein